MLWNVTSEFLTIAVSIEGDQPELSHDHIFILFYNQGYYR